MSHPYVNAAVERELTSVRTAKPGIRAVTLFKASAAIGGFVGAGALSENNARALLLAAAAHAGLPEAAALSHIRRGLARGAESPRAVPADVMNGTDASRPVSRSPERTKREATVPLVGVGELWRAAVPVSEDKEATSWIESRGLDVEAVAIWDLARAVPSDAAIPHWAWSKAGGSWIASGHRLLTRVWDAAGRCCAVRARCLNSEAIPAKSLAPAGQRVAGLVMACPLGVQLLEGRLPEWWTRPSVVVTEGQPDFWTWAARQSDTREEGPAVLGVEAGSWSQAIADRVPDGARVVIRTHFDGAGEGYARKIARTLGHRCEVLRPRQEAPA